jgi:hypothetical protein
MLVPRDSSLVARICGSACIGDIILHAIVTLRNLGKNEALATVSWWPIAWLLIKHDLRQHFSTLIYLSPRHVLSRQNKRERVPGSNMRGLFAPPKGVDRRKRAHRSGAITFCLVGLTISIFAVYSILSPTRVSAIKQHGIPHSLQRRSLNEPHIQDLEVCIHAS